MISRRAFFTFLAGGAALVGLPTAYLQRQIGLYDLVWTFRDCELQGGKFIWRNARCEGEESIVGWYTWIGGEKYSQAITLLELPTEEEAQKLTEVLQISLDRFRLRMAA